MLANVSPHSLWGPYGAWGTATSAATRISQRSTHLTAYAQWLRPHIRPELDGEL
jgi:hypothetical protein